jgi:tRNA dimethylallyltransferase
LNLPSMSGIGYRQIGRFLQNQIGLPETIQQIKNETHQFARRQYTWFRLSDARIHWFDIYGNIQNAINCMMESFLKNN